MGTTIVTNVGTSMSTATGRSQQNHLVYLPHAQLWALLYLSGTNGLSALTSPDFNSWSAPGSGVPYTLQAAHGSEGRNFAFFNANISSTDVLHMISNYEGDGSTWHSRFTLTSSNLNNTSAEASEGTATGVVTAPAGSSTVLDSTNLPIDFSNYFNKHLVGQLFGVVRASNTDAGSSWTSGFGTQTTVESTPGVSSAAFSLGSGNLMAITDNAIGVGTFNNLQSRVWNGSSWGTTFGVFASSLTTADANAWGAVLRTGTDVHVVALSDNSQAYSHARWNGSAWVAGDTMPNLTYGTNAGIFLASDGTNVWAFTIDTANNVQFVQWVSGSGWGSWSTVSSNSTAASYLTGVPSAVSGNIGLAWTVVNGSNYNIAGALFGTAVPFPVGTISCSQP